MHKGSAHKEVEIAGEINFQMTKPHLTNSSHFKKDTLYTLPFLISSYF